MSNCLLGNMFGFTDAWSPSHVGDVEIENFLNLDEDLFASPDSAYPPSLSLSPRSHLPSPNGAFSPASTESAQSIALDVPAEQDHTFTGLGLTGYEPFDAFGLSPPTYAQELPPAFTIDPTTIFGVGGSGHVTPPVHPQVGNPNPDALYQNAVPGASHLTFQNAADTSSEFSLGQYAAMLQAFDSIPAVTTTLGEKNFAVDSAPFVDPLPASVAAAPILATSSPKRKLSETSTDEPMAKKRAIGRSTKAPAEKKTRKTKKQPASAPLDRDVSSGSGTKSPTGSPNHVIPETFMDRAKAIFDKTEKELRSFDTYADLLLHASADQMEAALALGEDIEKKRVRARVDAQRRRKQQDDHLANLGNQIDTLQQKLSGVETNLQRLVDLGVMSKEMAASILA